MREPRVEMGGRRGGGVAGGGVLARDAGGSRGGTEGEGEVWVRSERGRLGPFGSGWVAPLLFFFSELELPVL